MVWRRIKHHGEPVDMLHGCIRQFLYHEYCKTRATIACYLPITAPRPRGTRLFYRRLHFPRQALFILYRWRAV